MSNKNSTVPFDQIPHIVINHPETDLAHKEIMRALFKVLKDEKVIIYSNEKLSKNCRIPLRTVERKVSELQKMGFILCTGMGFNRRISLGTLLNNSATVAVRPVEKVNNSATEGGHNRHCGGDTKNSTKKKKDAHASKTKKTKQNLDIDYQEYVGRITADINMGLKPKETKIQTYEQWLSNHDNFRKTC